MQELIALIDRVGADQAVFLAKERILMQAQIRVIQRQAELTLIPIMHIVVHVIVAQAH